MSAWWRTALTHAEQELRADLGRRFPTLASQHDDIVADALAGVAATVETSPEAFPSSWHKVVEPPPPDVQHFRRLCRRILERRVVDRFRSRAREAKLTAILAADDGTTTSAVDDAAAYDELLRATLVALDGLSARDRDLLLLVGAGDADASRLSPRDRQRLKRARDRLDASVRRTLGISAKEILGR